MPDRRRVAGAFHGLAEGIGDLMKLRLGRRWQEEQTKKTQENERMNQLLNDFDTSAKAITSPDHVAKVGADIAQTEYANLKRRLPQGVTPLLGADPDFSSLDSSPDERMGWLMKEVGAISNPDDPELSPFGLKKRAAAMRVPTDIKFPMMGSSPASDAAVDDPEFSKLMEAVQGQKAGLLAREATETATDVNTGKQISTTARQRNAPGFVGTQVARTPEQKITDAGEVAGATAQAETDVRNLPANQAGAARGAGMVASAQRRAELAAEMAQMGITGQQQTGALQLADDYEKASGDFFVIQQNVRRMAELSKQGTPVSDLGMVYSLMKTLDPGAAVQEGDKANAQNTHGLVPDSILRTYNQLITGEGLTPDVRADYVRTARTIYAAAAKDHEDTVQTFTSRAQQLRVPPSLVIRTPSDPGGGGPAAKDSLSPLERARAAAKASTPPLAVGVD